MGDLLIRPGRLTKLAVESRVTFGLVYRFSTAPDARYRDVHLAVKDAAWHGTGGAAFAAQVSAWITKMLL
jgi:hypothetical protein